MKINLNFKRLSQDSSQIRGNVRKSCLKLHIRLTLIKIVSTFSGVFKKLEKNLIRKLSKKVKKKFTT